MKFKIDENLPTDLSDVLHDAGYDAKTVYDENIQGCDDDLLIGICKNEGRVLITLDLDFSNILKYPPAEYNGIIVLRYKNDEKEYVRNYFNKIVPLFRSANLIGSLWVASEETIRKRREL